MRRERGTGLGAAMASRPLHPGAEVGISTWWQRDGGWRGRVSRHTGQAGRVRLSEGRSAAMDLIRAVRRANPGVSSGLWHAAFGSTGPRPAARPTEFAGPNGSRISSDGAPGGPGDGERRPRADWEQGSRILVQKGHDA